MIEVNGPSLVFTDVHFGLKSDSTSMLNVAINTFKTIIKYVVAHKINNVFFLGDAFHSRQNLNINTLNAALKCFDALSKYAKIYLIVGNHDIHLKHSIAVNSVNIYKSNANIVVVDEPTEICLNGRKCILSPWGTDLCSLFKPSTFDVVMGHFDVSEKYLIKAYIEEHSSVTTANEVIQHMIDSDSLLTENKFNVDDVTKIINDKSKTSAANCVGSFVKIAKPNGLVLSGHIHGRKEFMSNGRKFIFVGSPYQQNFGEKDGTNGFYVLDTENTPTFVRIDDTPRFVIVKMSDIINAGITSYDYSRLSNSITYKVYDVQVSREDDVEIDKLIYLAKPYEIYPPEYVAVVDDSNVEASTETIAAIRKSKLDYISSYIANIPSDDLEKNGINPTELYNILVGYYNTVCTA